MTIKDVLSRSIDAVNIYKKIKPTTGILVSITVILIPTFAWVPSYDFSDLSNIEIFGTALKRGTAIAGTAVFAWTLILSGRYKILDSWFNGLDQTYIVHRFLGTAIMGLLILHPLGYTVLYLAEYGTSGLLQHFLGFESIAITLGRISLYGLILIGAWSILAKVKHETFISIHRWLGVLFVMGAAHGFMSGGESILATNQFVWWYMLTLSTVATLTFIHYSILNDFLHKYYKYKVKSVDMLPGGVIDIVITPKYRTANFKPGQFFYVAFDYMDPEAYHPYSVASSNESSDMRFLIKQLGDYTNQLKHLKPGTNAKLKGPYGGFTFNDPKHSKQLWIAGGIGVTPFLSKAHSLRFSKLYPEVKMFHFAKTPDEALDKDVLDIIQKDHKAFDYTCLPEDKFGIVSLRDIVDQMGPLDEYAIYMCGPPGMLNAYSQQAEELGLNNQLYFEEFDY